MSTATSVQSLPTREESGIPPLLVHASAHSLLKGKVQATLERLLDFLTSEAHRQGLLVSKTEVHGFVDPEEDTNSVIVMQWVEAPPQRALSYWDHLGEAIETWTEQLSRKDAAIMAERIAIEVRWEADA